jgi:ubiquinone/menaquinone biosynthesis C-methylase UbiE
MKPNIEYQKVKRFYDDVYYQNATAGRYLSQHLVRLARRLQISSDQEVLDVACGVGDWLAVCAERGAKVSGIDISARAIEICRQRLTHGTFYVGPAEELPFADHSFDLVSCLGSLEHFLDQPRALREMVRVTKRDGQILLLVPNAGFLTYRLHLYRGTHQQEVRETILSLEEWSCMFAECGIEVLERWKDLHVLDWRWIVRRPWYIIPLRLTQALALVAWPLKWQYQVYHLCVPRDK